MNKEYRVYMLDRKGSIKCKTEEDVKKVIENLIKEGKPKELIRFKEVDIE